MAVNKVVYGNSVLMDVSDNTVTPNTLAEGQTATAANGEKIVGLMQIVTEAEWREVVATATNASNKVDNLEGRMDSGEFKGETGISIYYYDGNLEFARTRAEPSDYVNRVSSIINLGDNELRVNDLIVDNDGELCRVTEVLSATFFYVEFLTVIKGEAGVGISKIEKTSTSGNVDTYTITLTDDSTFTFTVTNGKDYVLTAADKTEIANEVKGLFNYETWTFTLADGSTVERKMVLI